MDRRKKEKAEYLVQSVDRALDTLESVNYQAGELGVTELAPLVKASASNSPNDSATRQGQFQPINKTGCDSLTIGMPHASSAWVVRSCLMGTIRHGIR